MQRKEFVNQICLGVLSLQVAPSLLVPTDEPEYDVLVLGAGLSGLAAARLLAKAGKKLLVLEAQGRTGGRVWTLPIGDDAYIDIGGQWIGKGHNRMYELVAEAGTRPFPTYATGRSLWRHGGRQKSYRGETPPIPLADLLAAERALKRLDKLAATLNPDQPWMTPGAASLDQQSLNAWLEQTIRRPLARQLIRHLAEGELCLPAQEVSLLQVLISARATGSLRQAEQVEDGALQDRIVEGAQTVCRFMDHELGQRVRLNTPVTTVTQTPAGVLVSTPAGTLTARKLIIAAPLAALRSVRFSPELPPAKQKLIGEMTMGRVIKCHAVYAVPFWRDQGLSGGSTSLDETVELSVDNSVPESPKGILATLITAEKARQLLTLSADERRRVVIEGFVNLFGEEARNPLAYHDYSFSANSWIGGAYSGYYSPGIFSTYGAHLTTPCGAIHWAGTETAEQFRGYMEGAVLAGERAAREILA